MLMWDIDRERANLAEFERRVGEAHGENNEALLSLLEDLIHATKRKILALEQLAELDDLRPKSKSAD